jgi:hypothetical protein
MHPPFKEKQYKNAISSDTSDTHSNSATGWPTQIPKQFICPSHRHHNAGSKDCLPTANDEYALRIHYLLRATNTQPNAAKQIINVLNKIYLTKYNQAYEARGQPEDESRSTIRVRA